MQVEKGGADCGSFAGLTPVSHVECSVVPVIMKL